MTRLEFRHLALASFSAIGLYVAATFGLFVAGLAAGFIAHFRTPTGSTRAPTPTPSPAMVIRYVHRSTSAAMPSAAPLPEPSR